MQEMWKDIKGYEGMYQISNFGNVRSLNFITMRSNGRPYTNKFKHKKIATQKDGYEVVNLVTNKKTKYTSVHRLVAIHFVDNSKGYKEVNHIDGNKKNNHFSNLEWCTRSENITHAIRTGLRVYQSGEKHKMCKISDEIASEIAYLRNHKNFSGPAISKMFGITRQQVYNIAKGKRNKTN